MTAQFAKGNLGAKALENRVASPSPRLLHPGTGKENLDLSTTSPPPASSTGAALTGASDILGVDGGLGRLEGTGAENVVGAQGHGVHPVSVALQRAAQDPLGTKPPSDRDRQDTARLHSTHYTHWAARTNPKLSKPACPSCRQAKQGRHNTVELQKSVSLAQHPSAQVAPGMFPAFSPI